MVFYLKEFQSLCYLITHLLYTSFENLEVLLLNIAHFDKSIVFPLLVSKAFGFTMSISFLYFKQHDNIVS